MRKLQSDISEIMKTFEPKKLVYKISKAYNSELELRPKFESKFIFDESKYVGIVTHWVQDVVKEEISFADCTVKVANATLEIIRHIEYQINMDMVAFLYNFLLKNIGGPNPKMNNVCRWFKHVANEDRLRHLSCAEENKLMDSIYELYKYVSNNKEQEQEHISNTLNICKFLFEKYRDKNAK